MVHALEKIHRLLVVDGILIDLHPVPDLPTLDVRIDHQTHLVGWLRETKGRSQYERTDEAINEVCQNGLFSNERSETFTYSFFADSVKELTDYLDEAWTDAITDDVIFQRATELMRSTRVFKEVGVHESVRIARLRRFAPQG